MEMSSGYNNMIGYAKVVSVSTLYNKCSNLVVFSCFITRLPHEQHIDFLLLVYIYIA